MSHFVERNAPIVIFIFQPPLVDIERHCLN
jgi:hypothetical protein